jgi:hypothetical protein
MFISPYLHRKRIIKIFFAVAFFKAPCTLYRGGIKNFCIHMFLHLASLLHIKIHKNMWAHEGPHISEKTQKEVGT